MRAVQIHQTGGPEVLRLEDVPLPEPTPGQVRVRLAAAGLNFLDLYHRTGLYPLPLPARLGMEGAGVVEALGPGVDTLAAGDRVAFTGCRGAYAEAIVAPADRMVPVPDGIDLEVAAAVMLQGITAHYLTHSTFPLGRAHTALVLAAAGGVGHLLVQVAKRTGARVIGTTSTAEKEELARRAGADAVIRYRDEDLAAAARRLTDGAGVDVVYDSVGRDTFDRSLASLRSRGCCVLYGQSSGPVASFNPAVLAERGSLFLTRPGIGDYMADTGELRWRSGALFDWVAGGALEVRIDRRWPLDEVAEAHRYMEAGSTRGKVLLIP